MLLTEGELKAIDPSLTKEDLLATEEAIRSYTNNHFHIDNYRPLVEKIENNRVFFKGVNLFQIGDTVEIVGSQYFDGFYQVKEASDDFIGESIVIESDFPINVQEDEGAKLFLCRMPSSFKVGVKEMLTYKVKSKEKQGIKSETIARMSITYESPQDSTATFNGIPAYLYDFCTPYIKMGW